MVEVAFDKSTYPDAAGAEDGYGKGRTPKDAVAAAVFLGMQ